MRFLAEVSEAVRIVNFKKEIADAYTKQWTKEDIITLEKTLDKLYKEIGWDFEPDKRGHFLDQLNNRRNKDRPITFQEVLDMFTKAFHKHKEAFRKLPATVDIQYVLKYIQKDLNAPFLLKYNSKTRMIDMIPKTVMRKKNFGTTNRVFKV